MNDKELFFAHRFHINFMQYVWCKNTPFIVGEHTKKVCNLIDDSIKKYRNGQSVFCIVKIPFRHGKSDIISRYLPPHFLGIFPHSEILVSTYSQDFVNELSRFSRMLIKSEKYQEIYRYIKLSQESHAVQNWKITEGGSTQWSGIGGSVTGRGYDLGIIDDFLKNREEAESETIREKHWDWFTNVFLTRRAPKSITIILATPWHTDDLIGRVEQKINPNSKEYDENFPQFEVITMPAFSDNYADGVLFPERFSKLWYEQQRATLGSYGTASLLQCNPTTKGGNILKTDNIKIIDIDDFPRDIQYVRAWDLASTEKELLKNDPDYTVGLLVGLKWIEENKIKKPLLYIKDMKHFQKEATQRDNIIKQTAMIDGYCRIGIESVAGYKDTYIRIRDMLEGIRKVEKISVMKDKLIRANPLEPIFEAGNIYLARAEWNYNFIQECSNFPSGKHDDIVDSLSCAWEMLKFDMSRLNGLTLDNKKI